MALGGIVLGVINIASSPTYAADKCEKLDIPSGYVSTKMTASQYHFMQGFWLAFPGTPVGMPPGDGAFILSKNGKEGGAIILTKGGLACSYLPAPKTLLDYLAVIKDGPGEEL